MAHHGAPALSTSEPYASNGFRKLLCDLIPATTPKWKKLRAALAETVCNSAFEWKSMNLGHCRELFSWLTLHELLPEHIVKGVKVSAVTKQVHLTHTASPVDVTALEQGAPT